MRGRRRLSALLALVEDLRVGHADYLSIERETLTVSLHILRLWNQNPECQTEASAGALRKPGFPASSLLGLLGNMSTMGGV